MNMFVEFVRKTLTDNLGETGEDVFFRVTSKKNIDEKSSDKDLAGFITSINHVVSAINDQATADKISEILKNKLNENKKIDNGSSCELKNFKNIDHEIEKFLKKNSLPTERDILDYAKYLTLKYGEDEEKVKKGIIERVKDHIKIQITNIKINEEIDYFLEKFPQSNESDVNDFIHYLRILNLKFNEEKIKEKIEKERLYRKFHEPREVEMVSEIDQFIGSLKSGTNKKSLEKEMKKQNISYLIKDESGVSDNMISEFLEIASPDENDIKDTLDELGLEHMIKKK